MASPEIVNRIPSQNDEAVASVGPFRFGVRDTDTRADLSSLDVLVTYGDGVYNPGNGSLPEQDETLAGAGVSTYFSVFDDSIARIEPNNPCDQSLALVSSVDVYRIEKSDVDGSSQEGILYLHADVEEGPVGFSARVGLANVNVDIYDYVTFSGFTGVLLGLVYWPKRLAVYLFFVDDGTKKVVVAGPPSDDLGTRSTEVEVVFDWSTEAFNYTIVFDASPLHRTAWVCATDSAGEETLLAEIDLDTLSPLREGVPIGGRSSGGITCLVGGDFPDMGDYIDLYDLKVFDFGRVLLAGGNKTGACGRELSPTESVFFDGPGDIGSWLQIGDGALTQTTAAAVLETSGGADFLYREEPDLSAGEWLVIGRMALQESVHPGTYSTGAGLEVDDGTRKIFLTLLDDFSNFFLGLEESDATDDDVVTGYKTPSEDLDWSEGFDFTLQGSASRDVVRLFLGGSPEAAIDHPYSAAGWPSSGGTPGLSVGFPTAIPDLEGKLSVGHFWLLPFCSFFEGLDSSTPEAQGWTRFTSSASRSLDAGRLCLDCLVPGSFDIYYIGDSGLDFSSGLAVHLRFQLENWTDAEGAVNPIRTEIGPIVALRMDAGTSVQLFAVQTEEGNFYLYLPGGESDVEEVLAQSSDGRAVSALVDVSEPAELLLDVKPQQYVRLYLNRDPDPVIDIPWASYTQVVRADPPDLPSTAVVAVGSLGEDGGVEACFDFFRASIGRGYDLSLTLELDEDTLEERVYGTEASMLISLQDKD